MSKSLSPVDIIATQLRMAERCRTAKVEVTEYKSDDFGVKVLVGPLKDRESADLICAAVKATLLNQAATLASQAQEQIVGTYFPVSENAVDSDE